MASEQVKRYTTVCELGCETRGVEHKIGEWVDYEDYAALLARCEQAEAMARVGEMFTSLVEKSTDYPQHAPTNPMAVETMLDWIDRAKKAEATVAACKAAGFVDPKGNARKVLGTLPITADGCVVGTTTEEEPGHVLWAWSEPPNGEKFLVHKEYLNHMPSTRPLDKWYSTRTAAEAARGGTP